MRSVWAFITIILASGVLANEEPAIYLDGRLDEALWEQAKTYSHFVLTDPDTGATAPYATQAKVLMREEGIYIGFINSQPVDERVRVYSRKDEVPVADFNRVVIDFNGNGTSAYEFTVSLGEGYSDGVYTQGNQFNSEWDGIWHFSVAEDEQHWASEIFLPWSIAVYVTDPNASARNIGLSLGRVQKLRSEEISYPGVHWSQAGFASQLATLEVTTQPKPQQLTLIPQVASHYDVEQQHWEHNLGMDFLYRPTSDQLLMATINPDFGAVDSDELISNFSPVETLLAENRTFFTENHSLFDIKDNEERFVLINTRRIGTLTNTNGELTGGLNFASKYLNLGSHFDQGFLIAEDKDAGPQAGKRFYVGRTRWHSTFGELGWLGSLTKDSAQDRKAQLHAVDYHHYVNDLTLSGNLMTTEIESQSQKQRGEGAFLSAEYALSDNANISSNFLWLKPDLDINDLGYMERNNIKQWRLAGDMSFYDVSPSIREIYNEFSVKGQQNFQSESLATLYYLASLMTYQDTSQLELSLDVKTSGLDDLISFGHGSVHIPQQSELYLEYINPFGKGSEWSIIWGYLQEGLEHWSHSLEASVRHSWQDAFTVELSALALQSPDWLIGEGDGTLGHYERQFREIDLSLLWYIQPQHEMTLRLQWNGLQANALSAFNIANQSLAVSADTLKSFAESDVSFQLKYQYQLAPLSFLTIAYTRQGGFFQLDDPLSSFSRQWEEAFRRVEESNLTVKLTYAL
ncbi:MULTISPECIES: DUF5916 domain-containing protein [unclassified Pseudoalteromonas]|uniref:DUF5916 domain-containing protein n=1 Tax=unclassified Pseudoalteromonas TaxID=194690 RepID=UPI001F249195|nr:MULTISPECIES: DUF5916 domain-containing protein [unclassified Pseudoalteromonas]MCF2825937.1 DUF5916 domain-containing protein [Pseudoalteromonas sp. OF5H-5]MCF2829959.1 DUF5916 domain-containing protein [Pseudoalteromonas sp. DL2-H6]MCF2925404.1 DUF5916 domain-containing protein [Pseudoalteromonas sp. DL2-H1]